MGTTNVVSIVAQPFRTSYLAFETGGTLEFCRVKLGDTVSNVDYRKLIDMVKSIGAAAGDPSRLLGDASGVMDVVQPFTLAALRNEDRKASLDSAVNSRQNTYFSKYGNAASVISTIRAFYSKTSPAANPNLLDILSDLANEQLVALTQAYEEDDRQGVVKATSSTSESVSTSSGTSDRAGNFIQESVGRTVGPGKDLPHDIPPAWQGYGTLRFKVGATAQTALTVGTNYEVARNDGRAGGSQSTTHVDYEYRTPYVEARARNLRAQITLNDQQFGIFMFAQNIPHLEQIFANELASIDNDVYQLQLALMRTCILACQPGVVTGIYKRPGDVVSAGEPVLRVEDNRVAHLVVNLVYHGPVRVGASATVTTTLRGGGSLPTTLTGNVVAARGQASGAHWEVVIKVDNVDGVGQEILAPNYWFDAEYTAVTIV